MMLNFTLCQRASHSQGNLQNHFLKRALFLNDIFLNPKTLFHFNLAYLVPINEIISLSLPNSWPKKIPLHFLKHCHHCWWNLVQREKVTRNARQVKVVLKFFFHLGDKKTFFPSICGGGGCICKLYLIDAPNYHV